MWRKTGGIFAGLVVWIVVVSLINRGLRYEWPAYAAVEKALTYTLAMMAARLGESAISSLVSGWAAARIGGRNSAAIAGLVLLFLFLPEHYMVWHRLPVWYHLTFLISLPVLSVIGGKLARW